MTPFEMRNRRANVLDAARWCFLNLGYSKTSLQDIAKMAGLNRTLLYKLFENKEAIFFAVFEHWLIVRQPLGKQAAEAEGPITERLYNVCKLMFLDPWSDMIATPMGTEYLDVSAMLNPEVTAQHGKVIRECVSQIIGSKELADIFLLALGGFIKDKPTPEVLEQRVKLLATQFCYTR